MTNAPNVRIRPAINRFPPIWPGEFLDPALHTYLGRSVRIGTEIAILNLNRDVIDAKGLSSLIDISNVVGVILSVGLHADAESISW